MIKEIFCKKQKIRKIIKIEGEQDVFSIETKNTHTFLTSDNLLIHNCFPKDTNGLYNASKKAGYEPELIGKMIERNEQFVKRNNTDATNNNINI